MKKISLLLMSLILLISLTACGYGELEGEIIDKSYKKAYSSAVVVKTGDVFVPIVQNHPESWKIRIEKTEDYKIKTTWVNVTEEYYNNVEIGDYYIEK